MTRKLHTARFAPVILATVAWTCAPGAAQAQSCNFNISNVNFGTFSAATGAAVDTTATLTATCSGTSGRVVRVCPNLGSGTGGNNSTASVRYALNGTNTLGYNLYQDSARSVVWGSVVWPWPPTPPVIDITLSGGSGSASATIYGRVLANQSSLPPGNYNSAFSGGHTLLAYQYQNTTPQSCSSIGSANGKQVSFNVSATLSAGCTVQATALDFGTASNITSNVDASNTVSVTCSSGTPYTIALDGGLSGANNPAQRKMTNPGTADTIIYGIYRDANRAQVWGSSGGVNTIASTGTGATQTFVGYGRVPPQGPVTPLSYSDTVVVTVSY